MPAQSGAEQAEADGEHADHGAGAEADVHRGVPAGVVRGGRHAEVGLHREGHAEVADRGREAGTDQEEDRAADAHHGVVGRQREQQEERQPREDGQRPELPLEVGVGPLLHRLRDVLHVVGALTGSKNLLAEHHRHRQRAQRDQCDDEDQDEVATGEFHDSGMNPRHVFPPANSRE
jgi:hypothetical protein